MKRKATIPRFEFGFPDEPMRLVTVDAIDGARVARERDSAALAAMREQEPAMLAQEKRELIKASLNNMFGENAKEQLRVVESMELPPLLSPGWDSEGGR